MVGLTAKQLARETLSPGDTIDYYRVGFVMENRWLRTTKVLTVDASNSRSPIKLASGDPSDPSMWIKRKMDATGVLISTAKWRTLKTFTMVDGNIEEPTDAQILVQNLASIVEDVMATHSGGLASTSTDTYSDNTSLDEDHLTLLEQNKVSSGTLPIPCCGGLSDGDDVVTLTAHREPNKSNLKIVKVSGDEDRGLNTDNTAQTELTSCKMRVIHRGMSFSTAPDAVRAVKDFAIANGKSMIVVRRSGMDRQLKCSSSKCTFTVQIYRRRRSDRTYGDWYISRISGEHINCTSMPKPTTRQIAENPTFRSAVNATPNSKASSLVALLRERDGISLQAQMRSVYRARDMVNETEGSSLNDSYQLIESYLNQFKQLNPGSTAAMERDSRNRFMRAIVSVKANADSTSLSQRVLGIDCAHSKCPWYEGVQMTLVGQDGNRETVIIAFALVPSEDRASYAWFLGYLRRTGLDLNSHVIFCDRDVAMLSVAHEMQLTIRFCTLHIIRNVTSRFKQFTREHHSMVWRLQAAETKEAYQSELSCIELTLGLMVRKYLEAIPPEKWCVHANVGSTALFGWRTSNFVESQFGTQLVMGFRDLPPHQFIQAMCSRMLDRAYRRQENCIKWGVKGMKVTPKSMKLYETESKDIGQYRVQIASADISYVYRERNKLAMRVTHRVTLSTKSCTCIFMDQYKLPCRHLIATLHSRGQLDMVFDYFDDIYSIANYSAAFADEAVQLPLDQDLTKDYVTLPPVLERKRGRPKSKRIRSNGEDGNGGSVYRCGNCRESGHNKQTCKQRKL